MRRLAVIDSDTILYAIALRYQGETFDTDPDFPVEFTDDEYDMMIVDVMDSIVNMQFELNFSKFRAYLTGKKNFRYNFLPSYKWRRDPSATPFALKRLKELCLERYPESFFMIAGEEADDSCTRDFDTPEEGVEKIICHIDKDLDQVAGLHYGYTHQGQTKGLYTITEEQAEANLWIQVLAGDNADCYKGCPYVGNKPPEKGGLSKAQRIVFDSLCVKPYTHTFTRGKRAGETIVKWEEYIDKTLPIAQRVLLWYIKGYVLYGGQGHSKGFETTSGFEDAVKVPQIVTSNSAYLDSASMDFVIHELNIQYTIAYMLRADEEIPDKLMKVL